MTLISAACESMLPDNGSTGSDDLIRFEVADGLTRAASPSGQDLRAPSDKGGSKAPAPADSLYVLAGENRDSLWVLATVEDMDCLKNSSSNSTLRKKTGVATKAAMSTSLDDAGSFNAWSWMWQGANSQEYCYINSETVTKDSSDIWAPVRDYPWPGKGFTMDFFAVAPAGAVNIARSTAGKVSFQWRVPADPTQQPDIMVASASNIGGKSNTPVSMAFSHIMSAVKVVTGDDFQAATVTSVKFKYIKSSGEYEFGTGWQNVTNVDNFELKPNKLISATPGEEIVGGANTFMMIPQDFAAQAELEITLTDAASGQTRTLSTPLTGSWEQGKVYTYRISTSKIEKEVTFSAAAPQWDHTGKVVNGQNTLQITSTYRWKDGNGYLTSAQPQPWTAQWVDTLGNSVAAPTWILNTPTSGNGGNNQTYNITATAQSQVRGNPHNDALKAAKSVTDYDLSTKGGTEPRNTANCYIVNGPGTYLIPLVYGNAVKNGVNYDGCYKTTANVNIKNFINHTGAAITNSWIENNANCTASNATLIWQDVQNMISVNSTIYSKGGTRYLKFTVNAANIKQGNAIVAVRNSSNVIMWSWHIWVTDYVPGLPPDKGDILRDKTIGRYDFMPLLLGFCFPDGITYPKREVVLRINAGGQTVDLPLISHFGAGSIAGRTTYFQWGRKDPMLPTTGDKQYVTAYNSTGGNFTFQTVQRTVAGSNLVYRNNDIAADIQHPGQYNYTDDFYGYYANNLWNITGVQMKDGNAALNNPIKGIKTVYDPTPAGYQIPTYHQLREFGNNIVYDSTKIALIFTVGGWTIQLPVLGLGYPSGNTTLYGTTCIAMSCVSTAQRPSGNPYLLMMNVRKGLTQNNTKDLGNPPSKWWGEAGNMSGGCYTVLPVREL